MVLSLALATVLSADPALPLVAVGQFTGGTPAQQTLARDAVLAELKNQGVDAVVSEDPQRKKAAKLVLGGALVGVMGQTRVTLTVTHTGTRQLLASASALAESDAALAAAATEAAAKLPAATKKALAAPGKP